MYLKELPKKRHNYYRNNNGCMYNKFNMTDSKVMLHCTRYKVDVDSVWSNYNECKKTINNPDNTFTAEDRVHCPGLMGIRFIGSNVGRPKFPLLFTHVDTSPPNSTWTWVILITILHWKCLHPLLSARLFCIQNNVKQSSRSSMTRPTGMVCLVVDYMVSKCVYLFWI